ncbi:MAG: DMT family transporter [Bacteroidales bacterium]
MGKLIWIILALLAGATLPFQAGVNARLSKYIDSPMYATLFTFLLGFLSVTLYLLLTRQTVSIEALKAAPAYSWLGGLLGAFYVGMLVFLFPQLGAGLTFGLIVAGQMTVSLVLDHFKILVEDPQPITIWRILGVVMIVVGVVLVQKS